MTYEVLDDEMNVVTLIDITGSLDENGRVNLTISSQTNQRTTVQIWQEGATGNNVTHHVELTQKPE